jgi:hypothetical protein
MRLDLVPAVATALLVCTTLVGGEPGDAPPLVLDFTRDLADLRLFHGARRLMDDGVLRFKNPLQYAELPVSKRFNGIDAMTVGGWFYPQRAGEQSFLFRGIPECGPNGERMFRPQEKWVNFVLGTDQHGFFLGTINGNGTMPFPHVTLNEVPIDSWSQLVVVKDARGNHKFYINGTLVHTDRDAAWSGKPRPFVDTDAGEPVRLAMPLGGKIGEAWAYPRELSAEEIKRDFDAKREQYKPALPVEPVSLRAMDAHPAAGLWEKRGGLLTARTWPKHRERILGGVRQILGPMPTQKVRLEPQVISEEDCGKYVRRKVSIQVATGDRMPAYLLIPKGLKGRAPAILCFYGTTSGAGKDTTVGL